jgi:hypothetical protein
MKLRILRARIVTVTCCASLDGHCSEERHQDEVAGACWSIDAAERPLMSADARPFGLDDLPCPRDKLGLALFLPVYGVSHRLGGYTLTPII